MLKRKPPKLAAVALAPYPRIDYRKFRVAAGVKMHVGDDQAIGAVDRLRIEIGAAHHNDGISGAAQRVAACRGSTPPPHAAATGEDLER